MNLSGQEQFERRAAACNRPFLARGGCLEISGGGEQIKIGQRVGLLFGRISLEQHLIERPPEHAARVSVLACLCSCFTACACLCLVLVTVAVAVIVIVAPRLAWYCNVVVRYSS
jgi:hypothetical protein